MLTVLPVPCLHDNYAYLLTMPGRGASGGDAAVVDACEAAPVLAALAVGKHRLKAVLATHHHHDHVGGNDAVHGRFPEAPIYAHAGDFVDAKPGRVPAQTVGLGHGEEFTVLGRRVKALHIPGHTLTALAYYFPDDGLLFTGDTLFNAGCGRLFEGTPAQMYESLQQLAALPADVRVYCGHEYTQKNLTFATAVEPDSVAIRTRSKQVAELRAAHEPTVPATLQEELQTNPFLRVTAPSVRAAAARRPAVAGPIREDDNVEVLARLRRWRDEF